ncbi:MAG: hypothetical protein UY58_C0004G0015 [Candidatus Magasanikbacteria bacterium GW2011_GWA2_50_22]|uniref:EF-hand domain-containing protein n=1 Tax=Candidatus Magasanikbacteria bacterium GW2011_GWA2_50_22 TaxID=1619043 RepID=A0A0G1WF19_9BACT|nr:MAG: hypothetical protein UY58_C0004G0015 [Candidatus Magasanikbacteria bacterium GW2011_GWA2_50_22]
MSEPIIHVIPEQYYGGGGPRVKMVKPAVGVAGRPSAPRKLSRTTLFIIVAGILFLITVGGAGWYFTRGLRAPTSALEAPPPPPEVSAPEAPAVEAPSALVTPEVSPIPAEPETPTPTPTQPEPFADTDQDGLTESEERLYQSDPVRPDMDNDGFLDGHEVINLYNPAGIAPEKLEAAGLAKQYSRETGAYNLLIPARWQAAPSPEDQNAVFVSDEGGKRIFELRVIDNAGRLSLEDWYQSQRLAVSGTPKPWVTNKSGLTGLTSADEAKAYFAGRSSIYEIMFAEGQNPAEYKTTFGTMLNSFMVR